MFYNKIQIIETRSYYTMEKNKNSPIDKKRIERYIEKLEHLKQLLKEIYKWTADINIEDFIKLDLKEQFGIYHAFQIIIEIMTDIIAMTVKDLKIKPKDDYSNIECLEKEGFLSNELTLTLRKVNGLRNVLVHDYNGLDDSIAFRGIKEYSSSIEEFCEVISQWLKKNS